MSNDKIKQALAKIDTEVHHTQVNKVTEYHLGQLKAKQAKLQKQMIQNDLKQNKIKNQQNSKSKNVVVNKKQISAEELAMKMGEIEKNVDVKIDKKDENEGKIIGFLRQTEEQKIQFIQKVENSKTQQIQPSNQPAEIDNIDKFNFLCLFLCQFDEIINVSQTAKQVYKLIPKQKREHIILGYLAGKLANFFSQMLQLIVEQEVQENQQDNELVAEQQQICKFCHIVLKSIIPLTTLKEILDQQVLDLFVNVLSEAFMMPIFSIEKDTVRNALQLLNAQ